MTFDKRDKIMAQFHVLGRVRVVVSCEAASIAGVLLREISRK
jgi:hypothetical protein